MPGRKCPQNNCLSCVSLGFCTVKGLFCPFDSTCPSSVDVLALWSQLISLPFWFDSNNFFGFLVRWIRVFQKFCAYLGFASNLVATDLIRRLQLSKLILQILLPDQLIHNLQIPRSLFISFKTNTTNSASRSTYPQFANTKIVICLCVNNEEILDTIPFKKENSVSDQKGKNVVSFLSSSENTVQKTLVADNRIAINKGQAFFQKNRNGVVERYMQGRPRPSASRVTVQGPKKLGAPKLLGWYIYICFYKSINL
nr:uncharacterized protein LOC103424006 [Malus domestica]